MADMHTTVKRHAVVGGVSYVTAMSITAIGQLWVPLVAAIVLTCNPKPYRTYNVTIVVALVVGVFCTIALGWMSPTLLGF